MAINPSTSFPGQSAAPNAAYPLGSAQNITTPGDGTGTPWVDILINDIWGLLQSLLDDASITASGTPDQVGASQYLTAIKAVAAAAGGSSLPVNGETVVIVDTSIVDADKGKVFVLGATAVADRKFTLPAVPANWLLKEQVSFINRSAFTLTIEVDNTGTHTIGDDRIEKFLSIGGGRLVISGSGSATNWVF